MALKSFRRGVVTRVVERRPPSAPEVDHKALRDVTLTKLSEAIAQAFDPYAILDTVRSASRAALQADFAAIALNDDRNGEFVWASQDLTSINMEVEPAIFESCRAVLRKGRGTISEIRIGPSIFSFIAVLLSLERRPAGVIALLKRRGMFSPGDQEWLRTASSLAGKAIDRARSHRSLANERAELGGILDAVDSGVIAVSGAKRIVYANRRAEEILGIRGDNVVNREFSRFLPPQLSTLLGACFTRTDGERLPRIHHEVKLAGGAGNIRHLEVTITPWAGNDGPFSGVIMMFSDATSRQTFQERLQQMERLMSIGQTVAGVAHELNNPLSTIYGYAQILHDQCKDPAIRKQICAIRDESKRSAAIVRNLLTFSREHKLERAPVNLNDCVAEIINFRSYELRANKIDTRIDLDPEVPLTMADKRQIEQVLINIVNNAEYAMIDANGKGRLTLSTRLLEGGTRIRIVIADDGPGIPDDHIRKIFDPFFTTKPEGKGTGLGLSICFGIIREHGGQIWAESTNEGASFVIEIPVTQITPRKETVARKRPRAKAETDSVCLRGKRALVVDDEPNIIDLLMELLNGEGMIVEAAANGAAALNKIEHANYDVVLSDMMMPALDGKELMQQIHRKQPALSRRVIYMTGSILSEETLGFINDSGADHLQKPFDLREVLEKIRRRIGES